MPFDLLLAIDIGGTKLAVGVARHDAFAAAGSLAGIIKEAVPAPGTPDVVIPRVIDHARRLAAEQGGTVSTIGISIGGPLDHTTGTVINFPHLPGWRDIPLTRQISEALGAPARMDNDANLGALAEHRWGAGRGYDDLVYLTISTGIGGGVIVNGRLVHGVGSAAAEVGHITVQTDGPLCDCGNAGCLERMASGTNIARRAKELLAVESESGAILRRIAGNRGEQISAAMVYQAVEQGDALAKRVWEEAAEYLAIGLAGIIHVLAPPLIVLGGGVAQAGEGLLAPVRERLKRHVFYVPLEQISVVGATLGHDSALLGAATLALDV
jgi:glucokinase